MPETLLETERLKLRKWKPEDLDALSAMNQDEKVMEHFPAPMSFEQSEKQFQWIQEGFKKNGFSWMACERKDNGLFIGFVGLNLVSFESFFTPTVEIGWRIISSEWNQGFATEGAKACLEYAFDELKLEEVHSFTALQNLPSQRVMQKIGMKKTGEFDHPKLSPDSRLLRHVLYCIKGSEFKKS